jgi:hypothetical protein
MAVLTLQRSPLRRRIGRRLGKLAALLVGLVALAGLVTMAWPVVSQLVADLAAVSTGAQAPTLLDTLLGPADDRAADMLLELIEDRPPQAALRLALGSCGEGE